jgi:opacity protein-like surface antigen
MKYTYIIFFMTVVLQTSSPGQAVRGVGLKVGGASASQTWSYSSNGNLETERRWGFDVAVFAEWLNIPVFSFLTELHYVQKGMKESVPITNEQNPDGTGDYMTLSPRVDYLSVPILAKARLNDGEFSPFIVVGPRVDFLLQTRGEGFQVVLDKFEKVDFGVSVGAGLDIRTFEKVQLGFEFRFSPSLKDGYSTQFLNVRNSSMEFLIVAGF